MRWSGTSILRNLGDISESRGCLQVRHLWLREEGVHSPWYIPETSGGLCLRTVIRGCGGRGLRTGERFQLRTITLAAMRRMTPS